MTQDVVALTQKAPDNQTLLAALYAGGPDLRVSSASEGAAIQLHMPDGVPLLTVEVPLLVQVPGEVTRLLGAGVCAETPVWWTEVRATPAVEEAGRLAGSVAGRLTSVLGGTTWPPNTTHTEVVKVSGHGIQQAQADHPLGVDVLTDRAAVIFQDRPAVAATTSLTGLLQLTIGSSRELQIVTPLSARLTLPARTLLTGLPARWVVRDTEGRFYDGLTGVVLNWRDGHFTPTTTTDDDSPHVADTFMAPARGAKGDRQLLLTIRTAHPADEHLLLGGTLESCWQLLTGAPPAGWSTAEPVNLPWSARQLTELARMRAGRALPTWLVAVGATERPAIATSRITHTPAGVEEHITFAIGYTAGQTPPLDMLPELAETLATRHRLTSMLTHLRAGRADLTTPPHREAPPIPLSFTLGPEAGRALGTAVAARVPGGQDIRPTCLGAPARPALHYPLGDGHHPEAWDRLKHLNDHLKRHSV